MTIYQFFLEDLISQLPQKQSVLMEKALLGSTYVVCGYVYVCMCTYVTWLAHVQACSQKLLLGGFFVQNVMAKCGAFQLNSGLLANCGPLI